MRWTGAKHKTCYQQRQCVPFVQVPLPWSKELCVALTRALWRIFDLFRAWTHMDVIKASNAGPPNCCAQHKATSCIQHSVMIQLLTHAFG